MICYANTSKVTVFVFLFSDCIVRLVLIVFVDIGIGQSVGELPSVPPHKGGGTNTSQRLFVPLHTGC